MTCCLLLLLCSGSRCCVFGCYSAVRSAISLRLLPSLMDMAVVVTVVLKRCRLLLVRFVACRPSPFSHLYPPSPHLPGAFLLPHHYLRSPIPIFNTTSSSIYIYPVLLFCCPTFPFTLLPVCIVFLVRMCHSRAVCVFVMTW